MKWSEFERIRAQNPTITNEQERDVFGSDSEAASYWHRCCEFAIEESAEAKTLGKLSWSEWTALCQAQRPKVDRIQ